VLKNWLSDLSAPKRYWCDIARLPINKPAVRP
jgi:hypothetical protein